MKGKYVIIPVLVIAFVTLVAAPPAQADFLGLSLVLAAAFASTAFVVENVRDSDTEQVAQATEDQTAWQANTENPTVYPSRP